MATTKPYNTSSAAGTTIGIASGDPATFDAAGFSALTYANIGKIKNAGDIGKAFEVISNNYLSQRGTEKRKGTFNAGKLSIEVDIKTDPGQEACEAALESDDDFNFQIKFKTGLTHYVRGQVISFTKHIGGPNDMLSATLGVELNSFFNGETELSSIRVLPVAP
jgi:hypothetical protein